MNCTNCGSPSARLYKRKSGGKEVEVCLCEECYEKLYSKADATKLFSNLFGRGGMSKKECPSCGTSLDSFRKSGLVGCSGCYTAFRNDIYESVRYCQWDSLHKGKEPGAASEEKYELVREQEYIKSQIDAAFQQGDFKLVEKLNRRLQIIHNKLVRTGEN